MWGREECTQWSTGVGARRWKLPAGLCWHHGVGQRGGQTRVSPLELGSPPLEVWMVGRCTDTKVMPRH